MNDFGNILIIGAHYDDAELGAGGVAARFVREGNSVYKITLTDNAVFSADRNLDIRGERAKQNSRDACEVLGVKELEFPTSQFGKLEYSQEIMRTMEHLIGVLRIDTVFMHYSEDYQTDHLAAHKISKVAARHCRKLFMYQSNPYLMLDNFDPNFFVDISDVIELKQQSLECYDKEQDLQGRLFDTCIQRNAVWGYGNHVAYAEGFMTVRVCL